MLSWFRRPHYDLLIEADRITLVDRSVRVEAEPRLSVTENGRIMAVGTATSSHTDRVIELFGPVLPAEPPAFEERLAAFVSVFRRLLLTAQKHPLFAIRPHVRVHGASLLRQLFNGAEHQFLRDALMHAGATKVEFAAESARS